MHHYPIIETYGHSCNSSSKVRFHFLNKIKLYLLDWHVSQLITVCHGGGAACFSHPPIPTPHTSNSILSLTLSLMKCILGLKTEATATATSSYLFRKLMGPAAARLMISQHTTTMNKRTKIHLSFVVIPLVIFDIEVKLICALKKWFLIKRYEAVFYSCYSTLTYCSYSNP